MFGIVCVCVCFMCKGKSKILTADKSDNSTATCPTATIDRRISLHTHTHNHNFFIFVYNFLIIAVDSELYFMNSKCIVLYILFQDKYTPSDKSRLTNCILNDGKCRGTETPNNCKFMAFSYNIPKSVDHQAINVELLKVWWTKYRNKTKRIQKWWWKTIIIIDERANKRMVGWTKRAEWRGQDRRMVK